ncbi:hypothetical protein PENSPDRAFT_672594 [Peniophora sp. CONT]|nr:hypothetical protein PENSPDRAFT_672594 [Peniophora sp. CONT]
MDGRSSPSPARSHPQPRSTLEVAVNAQHRAVIVGALSRVTEGVSLHDLLVRLSAVRSVLTLFSPIVLTSDQESGLPAQDVVKTYVDHARTGAFAVRRVLVTEDDRALLARFLHEKEEGKANLEWATLMNMVPHHRDNVSFWKRAMERHKQDILRRVQELGPKRRRAPPVQGAKEAVRSSRKAVVPRRRRAVTEPVRRSARVSATRPRNNPPTHVVRDDSPLTPLPETPPPDIASRAPLQGDATPSWAIRDDSPLTPIPDSPPPGIAPLIKIENDPRPSMDFDELERGHVRAKVEAAIRDLHPRIMFVIAIGVVSCSAEASSSTAPSGENRRRA